jgi:hypothetical protein
MATCPVCGGRVIHHSRLRNWVERLRCRLTHRAPFRCYDCGWRDDVVGKQPLHAASRALHRDVTDDAIDHLDGGAPGSLT